MNKLFDEENLKILVTLTGFFHWMTLSWKLRIKVCMSSCKSSFLIQLHANSVKVPLDFNCRTNTNIHGRSSDIGLEVE